MYNEQKIVVFDWEGVVENHSSNKNNCYIAKVNIIHCLKEETKKMNPKKIIEMWIECDNDENGKCYSEINAQDVTQKWFERIKVKFALECNYDTFYRVYQEESDKIRYYKNVVDFAHSLKSKCKIGILSNLGAIDKERINKQYDLSKFDFVWLSYELSCRKQNERIFQIVEEQCHIAKQNILLIDDNLDNTDMAKKRGWNVCLATGLEFDKIQKNVKQFLEE